MVLRGVKIPPKMLPLLDKLSREDEVWINNLARSEWKMLCSLREQGVITFERGAKVRMASAQEAKMNRKHRRLFLMNCFVFGMLLASNSWLGVLWLALA